MPSSYYSKLVRHRVASWTSLACAAWRYTVRTPNGLIHTYTTFSFTRAGSVYFASWGTVVRDRVSRAMRGLQLQRLQSQIAYTIQITVYCTGIDRNDVSLKPTHRG